ncbi:hypothetical protein [Desulfocurvus sp. DL9XJH121]
MNKTRLQRYGKPDLLFNGSFLAHVDGRDITGFSEDWMETSLYRTALGQYILYSECIITSCGRRSIPVALVFAGAQDLLDYMEVGSRPLSPLTAELLRQASIEDEVFELCGPYMRLTLRMPELTAQAG